MGVPTILAQLVADISNRKRLMSQPSMRSSSLSTAWRAVKAEAPRQW